MITSGLLSVGNCICLFIIILYIYYIILNFNHKVAPVLFQGWNSTVEVFNTTDWTEKTLQNFVSVYLLLHARQRIPGNYLPDSGNKLECKKKKKRRSTFGWQLNQEIQNRAMKGCYNMERRLFYSLFTTCLEPLKFSVKTGLEMHLIP